MRDTEKYDDIIDLPRPVSANRPKMSNYDRAAQFSPFAALTGYEEAVKESERLTDEKKELTDDEKNAISEKLRIIAESIECAPPVTLIYFVPDKRKSGGEYVSKTGELKEIDTYARALVFSDKTTVSIDLLRNISSPLLENYYFGE